MSTCLSPPPAYSISGKRDFILKSEDKGRRNRANKGEIGDIGFSLPGKGQGFPREWGGTLLLPIFGP